VADIHANFTAGTMPRGEDLNEYQDLSEPEINKGNDQQKA